MKRAIQIIGQIESPFYLALNLSKSISSSEVVVFSFCIEVLASDLIGDNPIEMLNLSDVGDSTSDLTGCKEKSNGDFFIGGMGLNGELKPVESKIKVDLLATNKFCWCFFLCNCLVIKKNKIGSGNGRSICHQIFV